MRKCDWTDYRQAMINNGYNDERAIESLVKREFHLADIFSAQKEFQNKWENAPDFSAKNIYIFNYLIMRWL